MGRSAGQVPNPMQDDRTQLILASSSPRRLELLSQIQIVPEQIIPADIDETPKKNELPAKYAVRMAFEKVAYVSKEMGCGSSSAFVLAGDTVAAVGRRILPKAETDQQAWDCLAAISGRRHRVYGGIALQCPDGSVRTRVVQSYVCFRRLSKVDIDYYIGTKDWQGKAGGYAIQGIASRFIRAIGGSYSNIVGLSLYDVSVMLASAGFNLEIIQQSSDIV
ncbi:Maf family nucleotide pyrophosphatase [Candidatus Puniceispirillum sp.]|nr:Maf family nucleotide pyrophosphatase [Candidatus Puniceispirillum sp.]